MTEYNFGCVTCLVKKELLEVAQNAIDHLLDTLLSTLTPDSKEGAIITFPTKPPIRIGRSVLTQHIVIVTDVIRSSLPTPRHQNHQPPLQQQQEENLSNRSLLRHYPNHPANDHQPNNSLARPPDLRTLLQNRFFAQLTQKKTTIETSQNILETSIKHTLDHFNHLRRQTSEAELNVYF